VAIGLLGASLLVLASGAPEQLLPAAAAASRVGEAAPAVGEPLAQAPTRVRITDVQITSAAGSYIAAEKGYFREEGIEAEFIATGPDQVPVVVADQADVAGAAINAFLFNAFARGIPIRVVADHGANLFGASAGGWVVRTDLVASGAYQGPTPVRGWKVGAATGSVADIALDRFLRTGGLAIEDVDMTYLPFPDILTALSNGALDGAYYQEPFTTIAVDRGVVVRGPIGFDIYPNQQIGVLLFGERLLRDQSASLRYLRAYVRGVRDYVRAMIDRDPGMFDQVVPILIEHTTVKDRSLFERAIPSGLRADPVPNLQSMADDQDWLIAHGLVQQRTNIQDMVQLSMVEQAIRELGPASP
jgi:NitT/TauT family transport system substrate-binding protein